jgi:hypothetical protein
MLLLYALDPFEPDFLTHGEPSAYPPDRSVVVYPSVMYLGWNNVSADVFMADLARLSAASLVAAIRTPIIGLALSIRLYIVSGLHTTRLLRRVNKELVHDKMRTVLSSLADKPQTYW